MELSAAVGYTTVHRDEAKAAGKRFVLGHREVFVGHTAGQACGFILVVSHDRLFHLEIDLLLSSIGGRHKAVRSIYRNL
jgi:hypothetical protein